MDRYPQAVPLVLETSPSSLLSSGRFVCVKNPWQLMIRHTKADLRTIPPPVRESALLNMSQQETLAYDTIVSFVRCGAVLGCGRPTHKAVGFRHMSCRSCAVYFRGRAAVSCPGLCGW